MKNYKIYLLADNRIQIYGITVKCKEIKQINDTAIYADNVYIDFDMLIKEIIEI